MSHDFVGGQSVAETCLIQGASRQPTNSVVISFLIIEWTVQFNKQFSLDVAYMPIDTCIRAS